MRPSPAVVEYYIEALDNAGVTETFPSGAPADALDFKIGVITVFLSNEFEGATNEGWTGGVPGDNATTGVWVRDDPNGTAAQSEDDHTVAPGVQCWFTGQGTPGGTVGQNDVDGGSTTLLSPVFDAANLPFAEVSYWRWYSNDEGGAPNADVFVVAVSNNAGASWTNVEVVGPAGPESSGGWFQHSFLLADFVAPTSTMQLRFVASDLGTGSIVEAAIDDIEGTSLGPSGGGPDCNGNGIPDDEDIGSGFSLDCNLNAIPDECDIADGTSLDCNSNLVPDECDIADGTSLDVNGNGVPDECECGSSNYCVSSPNSVGPGAQITFTGSTSVFLDDLVLRANGCPTGENGVFYYGPNQIQAPFGDGFRCVGGGVFRLQVTTTDGAGQAQFAVNYGSLPPGGAISPGDTWNFQFWYRDPAGPGGSGFNLSNGLSLDFCD